MTQPRVMVLRAPGTNCDWETAAAFERVGGRAERVHINALLERPARLSEVQILCIPGGFSYGDDIAGGKIFARQLVNHLLEPLRRFLDDGKLLLGICNGFQVLLKCGLLFADPGAPPAATLTWNDHGRYESRWVTLRVPANECVFLQGIERLDLPVAHAEGKFVARDAESLHRLDQQSQLALRYAIPDGDGETPVGFPFNPNGSMADVAGMCDPTGRAFGLMPHPERFIDPTHHPHWTRRGLEFEADGLAIFRNAVTYFRR